MALGAAAALGAAVGHAQDTSGPGVTLVVSPAIVSVHGAVTISGVGYAQQGTAVLVTVTPPGAAAVALQATPDAGGHYALRFVQTTQSGTYQVSARIGTKTPAAQGKFNVRTPTQASADLGTHEQALINDIASYTAQVQQAVTQMPDSPARTAVMQKLQPVEAKLGSLQQSGSYLSHALALFATLSSPVAFDIPVTGSYADGRVKFTLGDANWDFNPDYTQGHTVFVMQSPLTRGLPMWATSPCRTSRRTSRCSTSSSTTSWRRTRSP